MKRIAVVTTSAPPSASGQARVLGRLLARGTCAAPLYISDQIALLETEGDRFGTYATLSQPRFRLVGRPVNPRFEYANNVAGLIRDSVIRSREVVKAVDRHPVDVIVGSSGNPFDLPAAYLAARKLKLPFVAYLFDDPVFQWEPGAYRTLGRFWERFWARDAAAVIVPNEVLAADVRQRVPAAHIDIVRNPVDVAAFATSAAFVSRPPPTTERPWRLLYTGSVYSAQASAFRNIVSAIDRLGGRFKLDVYTSQGPGQVESCGLIGPHVLRHDHAAQDVSLRLQREADLLLLPLAFDGPILEVIRSSAPAKLGEYLAAGRPIFVHAPRGSFISSLISEHRAGIVVDTPTVDLVVKALEDLTTDVVRQQELVKNAAELSKEFHVDRARAALWTALDSARL